jgi:hypothetical protein
LFNSWKFEKLDDVDFQAGAIRVDESADQRTYVIGPCKNAAAYRTVLLADREGQEALRVLKAFLGEGVRNPDSLLFHSRRGSPLRETNVLHDGLHPAIKALRLRQAGITARYTGEIPIEEVRAAFSISNGPKIGVLKNGELLAVYT